MTHILDLGGLKIALLSMGEETREPERKALPIEDRLAIAQKYLEHFGPSQVFPRGTRLMVRRAIIEGAGLPPEALERNEVFYIAPLDAPLYEQNDNGQCRMLDCRILVIDRYGNAAQKLTSSEMLELYNGEFMNTQTDDTNTPQADPVADAPAQDAAPAAETGNDTQPADLDPGTGAEPAGGDAAAVHG